MGFDVNLSDILNKITESTLFKTSAGDNFKEGEQIKALFIAGKNEGDTLILTDTSGDNYTVSTQSLKGLLTDDQLQALMSGGEKVDDAEDVEGNDPIEIKAAATTGTTAAGKTEAVQDVKNVEATESSDAIQKKIDDLKNQKAVNQEIMTSLQKQIEDLKAKVEQAVAEALDAMEDAKEDQKEEVEKITADKIDDFQRRIENGEDLNPQELSAEVAGAIGAMGLPLSYQNAVSKLLFADTNMQIMSNLLGQLSDKIQIDKDLDKQIGTQEELFDEAKEAEAAAEAAKSCDPIGFQAEGLDLDGDGKNDNLQFDFFYDKDNDGKINSLDDFVGAKADKAGKDGWDEMESLDGAGGEKDGTITADELGNAGIKVMVTDHNTGEQKAMSMEDFEAQYGKIEIGAQDTEANEAGFNSNVGPKNFGDDAGNKLLSSFSLKVGDNDLAGYQTSDTEEWLVNNFGKNMEIDDIKSTLSPEAAKALEETAAAGEPNEFELFVSEYKDKVMPQLQKQVEEAYTKLGELGFGGEFITSLKRLASTSAETEGKKIKNENDEHEKTAIEEMEAEQAEEKALETENPVEDTDVIPDVDEPEVDPEIEDLEELDPTIW